jgi:carbon storage regulator
MLVLSRKTGEEVVIGDSIRLTVLEVHGKSVRLGLTAPPELAIVRCELCQPRRRPVARRRHTSRVMDSVARLSS